MKKRLLTLALLLASNNAISGISSITQVIRGTKTATQASKASSAAKAGTKVLVTEDLASTMNKTDKSIITDTKTIIAARSTLMVNKCLSSNRSSNKTIECNDKKTNYQQCIATEMNRAGFYNFSVDRCSSHQK